MNVVWSKTFAMQAGKLAIKLRSWKRLDKYDIH
jgi:hypothetical protein